MNKTKNSRERSDTGKKSRDETEAWKEMVRMDAIRIPHNAHSWISESASFNIGKL